MKAVLKFGLTALGLVLIIIGIGGLVVYTQAERYASRSIADMLATSFESTASIDSISVAPGKRALILHGVTLNNPAKFKEGEALTSDAIIVQFDVLSLFTQSPVIEQLTFLGTEVHYRYELLDGTNIGVLAKQFERASSVDPSTFVVNTIRCKDAKATFSTNLLPMASMDVNLVTVELDNLDDGQPISGTELASIFLRSLIKETLTINGLLNPIVKQLRKDSGDELEQSVTEEINK